MRRGPRALLLMVAAWVCACDPAPRQEVERPPVVADAPPQRPARSARTSAGFRSDRLFNEHFAKHGREFGDIPAAEYLRRAQALRDATAGGDILEVVRGDGVVSRFDRASGAFIAFDPNGTIRTFFRPNDGEAYFRRQAKRRPQGP